jgi:beta-lactamase regulating signal transducer with metallopeptidase domain
MTDIFAALVNGMIVSAILCGVISLVLKAIPRRTMNAATRYAVWWCAMAITIALPLVYLPEPVSPSVGGMTAAIPVEPPLPVPRASEDVPLIAMEPLPLRSPAAAPPEPAFVLPIFPIRLPASAWPVRVLGVWSLVSTLLVVQLLASWWLLNRHRSRAAELPIEFAARVQRWFSLTGLARRRVSVAQSGDVDMPVAVGPYRPAILLPSRLLNELDEEDLDRVGLHEAAHLSRLDDYAILVQRFAQALMALHPVVRWIARQIDLEREIACDDFVVAAVGKPRSYASCLARMAEISGGFRFTMAAGVADQRSHLSRRIETLLDGGRHTGKGLLKAHLAVATVVLWSAVWTASRGPAMLAFAPPPQVPAAVALQAAVPPPPASAPRTVVEDNPPPQQQKDQLCSVSGIVVSRVGLPIDSARIVLRPTGPVVMPRDSNRFFRSSTGPDGKFVVNGVTPGEYFVTADHSSHIPVLPDHGSPKITLIAGKSHEVKVEMMEQSTVAGKVVDEDGDPMAGALIEVLRVTYHEGRHLLVGVASSESDDEGNFRVANVRAGKYYLRATLGRARQVPERAPIESVKPGTQDLRYGSTYYPNAVDPSGASTFFVGDAQNVDGIDVRMKKWPWFHVRGKVIGDLRNYPETRVMRMPREPGYPPGWSLAATIRADGAFDLANMWPGQFTIAVITIKGDILGWTPITISGRDLENVAINAAASDIMGMVRVDSTAETSAAADSMPRLEVALFPGDGPSVFPYRVPAAEGRAFTIPKVAPGRYRVAVTGIPQGSYLKSVQLGGQSGLTGTLDLTAGSGVAPLEILVSQKAGTVGGVATDKGGKAVSGGTVTLVPVISSPGYGHLYPTARIDQGGRFQVTGVAPGSYRLYAWEQIENTAHWNVDFMKLFESRGQRVTVAESGKEQMTVTRISVSDLNEELAKAGPQDWSFYLIR